MRCVLYMPAQNYIINDIAAQSKQAGYKVQLYRNKVICIMSENPKIHAYCFDYGCVVCWGMTRSAERGFLEFINRYATVLLKKTEVNGYIFRYGEKTEIIAGKYFNFDVITLSSEDPDVKFAISYGLAQSAKLISYEDMTQELVNKYQKIPVQLAKEGKITLSKKQLVQAMGELFSNKSLINLSSEYLDLPEYFWEHADVESHYLMIEKYLDIKQRVSALNQRLNVLQDLFDILSNQLQYRHSTFLESVIVYLILIEIVLMIIFYFVQH